VSDSTAAHELSNLDQPKILTWNVPFYGDRRVAITVQSVHAVSGGSFIYELKSESAEGISVNRHFDLYSDVDLGRPKRVPLVLRLYLGNHSPNSERPVDQQFARLLRDTFSQTFTGLSNKEPFKLEPFAEYDSLFTFTEVLDDSHLDHTLVFQIDEFWMGKRDSLYDLASYWNGEVASMTHSEERNSEKYSKNPVRVESIEEEDANGFYLPHLLWHEKPVADNDFTPRISSREEAFDSTHEKTRLFRFNFFVGQCDGGQPNNSKVQPPGNDEIQPQGDGKVSRVPYSWDFGMILADRDLWSRYRDITLGMDKTKTIGRLWNTLCVNNPESLKLLDSMDSPNPYKEGDVTWDDFLSACRKISSIEDVCAFDVDLSTVESFSCWVLELWASFEFSRDRSARWFGVLTDRAKSSKLGLQQVLANCSASLLRALIQLVYTCPQLRSSNRSVYREHVSSRCVASREWYHTASARMKHSPRERLVPLHLPGNYAVRGDWSLAVAAGSRSEVLAHRALDLLSSRRNNLLRLQDGIGLPVRDILPDVNIGDVPTALVCYDEATKRSVPLSYRDVCCLGRPTGSANFFWLWRSQLMNYKRDCFYWRRWLARMLEEQHIWLPPSYRSADVIEELLKPDMSNAWSQFEDGKTTELDEVFKPFNTLLKILKSALRD
jgi:hypothetical protein